MPTVAEVERKANRVALLVVRGEAVVALLGLAGLALELLLGLVVHHDGKLRLLVIHWAAAEQLGEVQMVGPDSTLKMVVAEVVPLLIQQRRAMAEAP